MQNRFDMFDTGYGDRIHFLNLYEHLKKIGVDVAYSLEVHPDVSEFDLVHLFNISRADTYFQLLNAKKYQKPVVLTPIHISVKLINDLARVYGVGVRDTLLTFIKSNRLLKQLSLSIKFRDQAQRRAKSLEYNTEKFCDAQKHILATADFLCPGSTAEAHIMRETYSLLPPFQVVHVGIDGFFRSAAPDAFTSRYGFSDFVLCVGLVSPLKNQLSLIKALKGTGLKLVIAGGFGKSVTYAKRCREAAQGEEVIFIGHADREFLASAYAAAKVHVLPSLSETTGRASFEAALAGANVVVSNIPVHQEYCRDFVDYCDPSNIASIRKATITAFEKPRDSRFSDFIQKTYTWERMAQNVAQVYDNILSRKHIQSLEIGVI